MSHILFSFNNKTRVVSGVLTYTSLYEARVVGRAEYILTPTKKYIYSIKYDCWYRYDHKKPYDRGTSNRWKELNESLVPRELKVHMLLQAV